MKIEETSCELDWIRRSIKCRSWSEPITGTAGHSHIHGVSLRNGVRQNLIKVIPAFSPLPPVLCYENVIAKKISPSEIISTQCAERKRDREEKKLIAFFPPISPFASSISGEEIDLCVTKFKISFENKRMKR